MVKTEEKNKYWHNQWTNKQEWYKLMNKQTNKCSGLTNYESGLALMIDNGSVTNWCMHDSLRDVGLIGIYNNQPQGIRFNYDDP